MNNMPIRQETPGSIRIVFNALDGSLFIGPPLAAECSLPIDATSRITSLAQFTNGFRTGPEKGDWLTAPDGPGELGSYASGPGACPLFPHSTQA